MPSIVADQIKNMDRRMVGYNSFYVLKEKDIIQDIRMSFANDMKELPKFSLVTFFKSFSAIFFSDSPKINILTIQSFIGTTRTRTKAKKLAYQWI